MFKQAIKYKHITNIYLKNCQLFFYPTNDLLALFYLKRVYSTTIMSIFEKSVQHNYYAHI